MATTIENDGLTLKITVDGVVNSFNKISTGVHVVNSEVLVSEASGRIIRIDYQDVTSPSVASVEELRAAIVRLINYSDDFRTQVILKAHHEIHEGEFYSICAVDSDFGVGENLIIAFQTPDTTDWIHLFFTVDNTAEATFEILEDPTITVDTGTDVIAYNHNRNSANTSGILTIESTPEAGKATLNPTITNDGTILCRELLGAGKVRGGVSRSDNEWVLKQNFIYAVRLSGEIKDGRATLILAWYECELL